MSDTKKITVLVREVWIVPYEVDATDTQDALNKLNEQMRAGTAEPRDNVAEFSHTLSQDIWSFEVDGQAVD